MVVLLLPAICVDLGHTGNIVLLNGKDETKCKMYRWLRIPPLSPAEEESFSLRGQKYLNWEKVLSAHFRDTLEKILISSLLLREDEM